MILTTLTGDTITIEDWREGHFGVSLANMSFNTPEMEFQDWASDNGRINWDGINMDGSLDLELMAQDFDMPEVELLNLPKMDLGINMGNLDLGIDLSGVTDMTNTFVQEIIQGIVDTLSLIHI